jgi:hypothetical protein
LLTSIVTLAWGFQCVFPTEVNAEQYEQ